MTLTDEMIDPRDLAEWKRIGDHERSLGLSNVWTGPITKLINANAALTAALAVAPKPRVKALEWRESHGSWYGSAPYMIDYEIRQRGEIFYLRVVGKNFMSLAEAKAAAQADYEARILAALEDGQ